MTLAQVAHSLDVSADSVRQAFWFKEAGFGREVDTPERGLELRARTSLQSARKIAEHLQRGDGVVDDLAPQHAVDVT